MSKKYLVQVPCVYKGTIYEAGEEILVADDVELVEPTCVLVKEPVVEKKATAKKQVKEEVKEVPSEEKTEDVE